MDYQIITIPLLFGILLNFGTSSPINQKQDTKAVYVPYDVQYVPVEVPEKFLQVEPLNSKNQASVNQIFLKKEDILKHINNEANHFIEPVKSHPNDGDSNLIRVPLSSINQGFEGTNNLVKEPTIFQQKLTNDSKDIIVVPLSAISKTQKIQADPKEDLVVLPSANQVSHKIVKRQAQRFPMFRPFIRITNVSANRRRFGPSRNPALVGYMSNRDFFPTVA
ncbi:unnamed protein product [Ceutorhynchus assimilis]|uniref:Uncharacterized protein n=1 Tax=Ceutorhynchus assimilis TaxID=467358 RepID=A0A9N9MKI6_9CUCU|nr:unnamed protein product [Ceutorhynchus assimilis]